MGIQWIAVHQRFAQLDANLRLTPQQRDAGLNNASNVVECLNRHYYGTSSRRDNAFLLGAWGKDTVIRPPRDVDVGFRLPEAVYARFQGHANNRQSALLQEVRGIVQKTYPRTDIRGDGQVVVVDFGSFSVEVVPAFLLDSGQYWICDTNDGGRYKLTDPVAQAQHVQTVDESCAGNLRPLVRLAKAWQQCCSVWSLASFELELLAARFLQACSWNQYDWFWFDWISRDFFAYLCEQKNGSVVVPGTHDVVRLGDAWHSKAVTAHQRAIRACDYERDNVVQLAGEEWQKILDTYAPLNP